MIVQKCLTRSNSKKEGILGEIDKVQPKPSKELREHKNIIKECNFIKKSQR